MKCISPITLKIQNPLNKDGKVIVPCGKCINCLTNRRESWIIRLIEEFKTKKATFLTLTYNDENLVYADSEKPTLSKRDVQLFLKRLRKSLKKTLKYYCVGEYGSRTDRPHYHLILFNSSSDDIDKIQQCWPSGNITIADLNIRRLVYTTKYHINRGHYPYGTLPPFTLMSKGLGIAYVEKMNVYHNNDPEKCFYQYYNYKKSLPRYYRQKLYSREKLLEVKRKEVDLDQEMKDHYDINSMNFFKYKLQQLDAQLLKQKEKVNKTTTL